MLWDRVVHAYCWEIKVTRVLQNLSNLKLGHFFLNVYFGLAPVVQKLDSAIHRIYHYPSDKY